MRKKHITVVIADDHAILRAGLRMLLNQQPDIKVVGEAENGEHALEQVRLNKPDIILMDISMPGTGGVEATAEIRRKSPQTRVVILTMHAESAYLDSVLAAGASGYVLKRSLDSDLLKAIRSANEGETFIDSGVAVHLVGKIPGAGPHRLAATQAHDILSRRELQVLKLVAEGCTNRQIASQAFISVKSVETYRARLLIKLQIKTRRDIVRYAIEAGLLAGAVESSKPSK